MSELENEYENDYKELIQEAELSISEEQDTKMGEEHPLSEPFLVHGQADMR